MAIGYDEPIALPSWREMDDAKLLHIFLLYLEEKGLIKVKEHPQLVPEFMKVLAEMKGKSRK